MRPNHFIILNGGTSVKVLDAFVLLYGKMNIEKALLEAGHQLPTTPTPGGNYVLAKTVGKLVYLAGVVSTDGNGVITGKAGDGCGVKEGYAAARACILTQLAILRHHLGSLDAVKSIVSVSGYVNAAPWFNDSPQIINGASDLLVEVFGEAGRHVRAAIGVSALPRNALVEVQMVVEIE
jgi:enamine deaminase RidA (YjgF/YER057c/UK114 family)